MRLWGWLTGGAGGRVHQTRCAVCARTAVEARLRRGGAAGCSSIRGSSQARVRARAGLRGPRPGDRQGVREAVSRPTLRIGPASRPRRVCSQCGEPYCWGPLGPPHRRRRTLPARPFPEPRSPVLPGLERGRLIRARPRARSQSRSWGHAPGVHPFGETAKIRDSGWVLKPWAAAQQPMAGWLRTPRVSDSPGPSAVAVRL